MYIQIKKNNSQLMQKFLSSIVFFLLFALNIQAQQISGKIIDKANGESLPGAAVSLDKTTQGALTDIEGNYTLSVEPGSYTIVISFVGYETAKVNVEVKGKETTYLNYAIVEQKALLQEVIITAKVERSTNVAQFIERKKAVGVSDAISADLIRKTPDRTTSDVLKRVTGASIQEGKFAIIRGMNDRYNAGYLDGALLPSTEADRKAFAFDVVPANLLDNLTIIKAGSADLVGDFGGGVIKINTKAVPEKFTQSLNIGGQTHSLTTFKDFTQFKTYSGEQVNLFGNQRSLPSFTEGGLRLASTFASAAEKAKFADISQTFNNDWSSATNVAAPNARFAYSLGLPINLGDNRKIGLIVALNYANTRKISDGEINTFDGSGQVSNFNDRTYGQNINSGGIFNLNYVATKTQINFRNLLNMNTDNNTIFRTGMGNIGDQVSVKNTANLINYNRLFNSILSVKQIIGNNDLIVNGSLSYSNVRRKVPDYRIVSYTKTPDFDNYRISLGDFFNSSTGRFASDLDESLIGGNLELNKQFNSANIKTDVKVGYFYQNRDRTFWGRSFVYGGTPSELTYNPADDLGSKSISASKLYLVEKTNNELAYYDGKSNLNAGFVSVDQRYKEKLRVVYGVRYEDIKINVDNTKVGTAVANLQKGSFLPSVNASYSLTEKTMLRGSYFASVNRPEFRELAPFAFYVFDKNVEIKGNKDLKIANLNNLDLRYEFYPTGGQLLSAGVFYKTIANPVEFSIDLSQPFTTFTYRNEKSATIYGLELEAKKNLDFISKSKFFTSTSVFANLSLIKSGLSFDAGSQAKQDRPLQGQSPYIMNIGLTYQNEENGWFGSAVFNRVGRRIAYVGVDSKFSATRQDIFEAPRSVIDLQLGKNIGKLNIKLTVGDLLRNDLIFYQDADNNGKYNATTGQNADLLMFKYNNGFTTNLSLGYSF